MEKNWQQLWQESQTNPYKQVVITLLMLNGLSIAQIKDLSSATIDLSNGWITTDNNQTFPLISYSRDALQSFLDSNHSLTSVEFRHAIKELETLESEAHRRLAGAIWITDIQLQQTLEFTRTTEIPILPLRYVFPFSITEQLQAGEQSEVANQARYTLQTASDWLFEQSLSSDISFITKIIRLLQRGSLVFMLVSTGVNALNLIHNVLMGRLLSPADYSQLTFIITLQLLIGLLPTILQTIVARFTARYHAQDDSSLMDVVRRRMGRVGWIIGILIGVVMLILSPLMVTMFQLNSIGLLIPVIIFIPFFVRMGVDRGLLQGIEGYFWLSGAYFSEAVIRLGIGVLLGYALLSVGRSLDGAIWGLAQSMIATWFISWLALRHFMGQGKISQSDQIDEQQQEWLHLGWITGLALVGQMMITNSDFLLVKNFFSPEDAGLYAAVSVLGRIVYFGALPLTIVLVPLIARRQALNIPTRPILILLIVGGVGICSLLILVALIFAPNVLGLLYGDVYVSAAGLLAPYALAASLYTLTNLVITYQLALGSGRETMLPIIAGVAQIILVLLFHDSLVQVITIQIVLMGVLFGVVLWRVLRQTSAPTTPLETVNESVISV